MPGGVIFCINEETDDSRLIGDQSASVHRLGQQQFTEAPFLSLQGHRQTGKAYGRQAMGRIGTGVFRRK